MKYSLIGKDTGANAIISYTKSAMLECGMADIEISAYEKDARQYTYDYLVRLSIVTLDRCNKIYESNNASKVIEEEQ